MDDRIAGDYLRAQELYERICSRERGNDSGSTQNVLEMIRELEHLTGREFRTTSEFHREVQAYVENRGERLKSLGKRIRRARKARKWTLKRLASELGYRSHSAFVKFENDERLPPKEVIEWLLAEEKKASQEALGDENVSPPSNCSQE